MDTAEPNTSGGAMPDEGSVEKNREDVTPTPNNRLADHLTPEVLESIQRNLSESRENMRRTFEFITQSTLLPSAPVTNGSLHIPRLETPEGFTQPSNEELAEVADPIEIPWGDIRFTTVFKGTTPCPQCHNRKYFSGEPLMPCAVRPTGVDGDECSDFEEMKDSVVNMNLIQPLIDEFCQENRQDALPAVTAGSHSDICDHELFNGRLVMNTHPLDRLAKSGVSIDEFTESMLLIGGCTKARRDAIMAKRRGDWDAYEKALDELTDEELEHECKATKNAT